MSEPAPAQVRAVLELLQRVLPSRLLGVYLVGSAVSSRLRPDSDLDILAVTDRSLMPDERTALVRQLFVISGWSGHPERRAGHPLRPIELTVLTREDLHDHSDWRDFQYGEWLRAELEADPAPARAHDPDIVIVIAAALDANRALWGAALESLTPPVSPVRLRDAVAGALPDVVANLSGDERNVLLTLARMLVTVRTGRVVSKDDAAGIVATELTPAHASVLRTAADAYRGTRTDDWPDPEPARSLANTLQTMVLDALETSSGTAATEDPR
ncbi:aminoglycoside adenylyltransferase domain-containing protein [Microbacterium gorillae]|uniref:aminoglycoside adenylyltransferase domain-containing protein n=1 Tax=Microbacterium gorillae TaxID=1231063 RepID=UPI000694AE26|nr:aminoglycoside adenylyltransferase domain-containing protein [Microbacterium gorillae]